MKQIFLQESTSTLSIIKIWDRLVKFWVYHTLFKSGISLVPKKNRMRCRLFSQAVASSMWKRWRCRLAFWGKSLSVRQFVVCHRPWFLYRGRGCAARAAIFFVGGTPPVYTARHRYMTSWYFLNWEFHYILIPRVPERSEGTRSSTGLASWRWRILEYRGTPIITSSSERLQVYDTPCFANISTATLPNLFKSEEHIAAILYGNRIFP